jgi:hypothetical protein
MSIDYKAKRALPFVRVEQGNSCTFYYVPEFKDGKQTEKEYMVIDNQTTGRISCNCMYFAFKQLECSHIRSAKLKKESK